MTCLLVWVSRPCSSTQGHVAGMSLHDATRTPTATCLYLSYLRFQQLYCSVTFHRDIRYGVLNGDRALRGT